MNESFLYALADSDGRIVGVTEGPYLYVECDETVSSATHYLDRDSNEIREKGRYEYQLHRDGLNVTITGLPPGVSITANGIMGVTDDEPTAVSFDTPGTYTIQLEGVIKHLPESFEVAVDEPERK